MWGKTLCQQNPLIEPFSNSCVMHVWQQLHDPFSQGNTEWIWPLWYNATIWYKIDYWSTGDTLIPMIPNEGENSPFFFLIHPFFFLIRWYLQLQCCLRETEECESMFFFWEKGLDFIKYRLILHPAPCKGAPQQRKLHWSPCKKLLEIVVSIGQNRRCSPVSIASNRARRGGSSKPTPQLTMQYHVWTPAVARLRTNRTIKHWTHRQIARSWPHHRHADRDQTPIASMNNPS